MQLVKFLLIPRLRTLYCRTRWRLMRGRMKYYDDPSSSVADIVVPYNTGNMDSDAAFGCGGRMDLLLYPLKALLYENKNPKVLLVGPRTEDDIFLAKALSMTDSRGLDLFSYSPHVDLGDIHKPPYPDHSFDAVALGWVLVYCGDPQKVIRECRRILKPGGFLAIGWEWAPDDLVKTSTLRQNPLNEVEQIEEAFGLPVVFRHDPPMQTNHHKALLFRA